jgi:hypothetical protein
MEHKPELWACTACGAHLDAAEIDGVDGHCRIVDSKGYPTPEHCGPCVEQKPPPPEMIRVCRTCGAIAPCFKCDGTISYAEYVRIPLATNASKCVKCGGDFDSTGGPPNDGSGICQACACDEYFERSVAPTVSNIVNAQPLEGEIQAALNEDFGKLYEDITPTAARKAGWQYVHEHDADLIRSDGLMCEQHPGLEFDHDGCAGPGMPWILEGKDAISAHCTPQPNADAMRTEGDGRRQRRPPMEQKPPPPDLIETIINHLFTNGFNEKASRLLLIKEKRAGYAKVSNAKDLGGYDRAAVRLILKTIDAAIATAVAGERERCTKIANDVGTAAFAERQKQFTSKSPHDLIIVQDTADDIAAAIRNLEAAKESKDGTET